MDPIFIVVLFLGSLLEMGAAEWREGPGFRYQELQPPAASKPGFTQLSSATTGINFTNLLSRARHATNQIYLNGSGVAAGDVDGDGFCDLYFCGLDNSNVLYRNLGNWKFEDITARAGVACAGMDSTGAAFADIDGDGDLDLIVNTVGHGTHIFLNDGKGQFTELSPGSPINLKRGAMSLALADIDGDGDLDLYVTNYRTTTIRDMPNARIKAQHVNGANVVVSFNDRPMTDPELVGRFTVDPNGRVIEHGELDVLYLNDGKGHFSPVSFTDGTFLDEEGRPLSTPPYDWGLSAMFRDLNGDGFPDLYVCNDFQSPDRIWINNGKGQFRAIAPLSIRHTSRFSMGVDVGDLNRDGHDDIFVTDMLSQDHLRRHVQVGGMAPFASHPGVLQDRPQFSHNTLLVNRGDDTYAEIAWFGGVAASEWSWTSALLDVDLDGYEDILITNGAERDGLNGDVIEAGERLKNAKNLSERELLELHNLFPRLDTPNVAFRNRGNLTFEDVSMDWGFAVPSISNGMALADLDNDGDLDVILNNMNGPAGIFRNNASGSRIAVRLKGLAPNTRGIGAKIRVFGGAVPIQSQEMICGGRYLSGDEPMRVFAAGTRTNDLRIEISWRSGKRTIVEHALGNRLYEIDEAFALTNPTTMIPTTAAPLFEEVSGLINHVHHEEEFDDFERQPLLPNKLSQSGPGVAWHDLDGDGWDDLIIGSGKGGTMAVYMNDGKGGFRREENPVISRQVNRDQTTVLGLNGLIIAGSANYEDGLTNGGSIRLYDLKRKASGDNILGQRFSAGALALADIDGDGDLDLFVGGRVIAGRYPEAAPSMMMRNDGGRFVQSQRWEKMGMVSGAAFSDVNGDGWPDLIVACEWGGIRLFLNENGHFTEATEAWGLGGYTGWWSGVTTGDIDGDGRMDLIVMNWGLNSHYQTSWEHPRHLYYGDLAENGRVDLIESYYDEKMKKEVPDRGYRAVGSILSFVVGKMGSYESYARASLEEIYGEKLKGLGVVEAKTLSSMVFFNRGGKFKGRELPKEAQFAPGLGVCVADADGDGNDDIFISQNFFATNPEGERQDAGRGLWLRGDGKGGLKPLEASGVKVYGEQRGCAVSDYDGDGRVDLVVTQNGAETKLYRNVGARPGLRIRLAGPEGNPTGVGAQMRLENGDSKGPMREVHAGSGYWSQDSAIEVMNLAEGSPKTIWVRFPGGKTVRGAIPNDTKEIEVKIDGSIRLIR